MDWCCEDHIFRYIEAIWGLKPFIYYWRPLSAYSANYIHSQYSDPDYRASPPSGSGTVNTILKPIFSGNIV